MQSTRQYRAVLPERPWDHFHLRVIDNAEQLLNELGGEAWDLALAGGSAESRACNAHKYVRNSEALKAKNEEEKPL